MVLAGANVTNVTTSAITGNLGLYPAAGTFYDSGVTQDQVTGTIYTNNDAGPTGYVWDSTLLAAAKQALTDAYGDAAGRTPFTTLTGTPTATDNQLGGRTVTPGTYRIGHADTANLTAASPLILSGNGVYIFQVTSDLIMANSSEIQLTNGAQACNVFWKVGTSATLGTSAIFKGTILADQSITANTGAKIEGRLLASVADVILQAVTLKKPICLAVASTGSDAPRPPEPPTLTVFKHVINDNGGTAVASDSSIAVKIYGQNVAGSPAFGQENGRIYQLAQVGTTTVSELPMAGYTATFSGDCNSAGQVHMEFGDRKTCTITNNDIALVPPLINITKVPTPLALPGGAGSVTYDYLVTNLGTVAMLNVTVTDDKCANVNYVSGDLNSNSRLGLTEIWRYTCTTNLATTTTNIVTATGQANGFTATDIAQATVVVGLPLVPPLIHVIKWPSTFLLPAGGGPVTYYYFITNPGTEPLSNVTITDDKCTGLPGRVVGHIGDLNNNNLLDSNETWNFTCQTNLTQTTTNIGTATGQANGFTAIDLSPVTVVVASPKLPNTGFGPDEGSISWTISMLAGILAASTLFYFVRRKQTN